MLISLLVSTSCHLSD